MAQTGQIYGSTSNQYIIPKIVWTVENSYGAASEDFAYIAREIPAIMIGLSAGERKDGYDKPLHNQRTAFDERVLWKGSAIFASVGLGYFGE